MVRSARRDLVLASVSLKLLFLDEETVCLLAQLMSLSGVMES